MPEPLTTSHSLTFDHLHEVHMARFTLRYLPGDTDPVRLQTNSIAAAESVDVEVLHDYDGAARLDPMTVTVHGQAWKPYGMPTTEVFTNITRSFKPDWVIDLMLDAEKQVACLLASQAALKSNALHALTEVLPPRDALAAGHPLLLVWDYIDDEAEKEATTA